MSKRIILIGNSNRYEQLRTFIEEHGKVFSAVPPHLIECTVECANLAVESFDHVRIVDQPEADPDIRKLPLGIQIAARAYAAANSKTRVKGEGVSWNAPGLQAPGRPNAND